MTTTVETNVVTGEVTIHVWTEEEAAARIVRMNPLQWDNLRSFRNELLVESDNYVQPDRWDTYTTQQQLSWATYRQTLRDLPQNTIVPFNPVWPVKPE